MGQVKRWKMAMEEACTEAIVCGLSDEEQFEAVAKALKSEHWPVVDGEIKLHLKKAIEKSKDFGVAFQTMVDK
jgi:hypothetical protein